MKKVLLIMALVVSTVSFVSAQTMSTDMVDTAAAVGDMAADTFSNLPQGEWLDEAYDAVWTFSVNKIELFYSDGTPVFDFKGKMQDVKVNKDGDDVKFMFSSEEAMRDYVFTYTLKDGITGDMKLMVEHDNGESHEAMLIEQ